ncbi:MAG: Dihydrolipoamide acyltransferase [Myxococcaceae bacterium]|nr:Dihydrolipoamide acyltransferase [Myxococcaceae bacterium]
MALFEFKLPDIGEGVAEGEVVAWLVAPGERVVEDQEIVEVMTDKATVTIGAPQAGSIAELRAAVGARVPVGSVLVVIDTARAGEQKPEARASVREQAHDARAGARELHGESSRETRGQVTALPTAHANASHHSSRPPKQGPVSASAVGDIRESLPGTGFFSRGAAAARAVNEPFYADKPLATPATRKLARDLGIDLRTIAPSGLHGQVTKHDLTGQAKPEPRLASAGSRTEQTEPTPRRVGDQRKPFVGLRRRIAERMQQSVHKAAHFTFVEEVEVSALKTMVDRLKPKASELGVKLPYLPFIVKAVTLALKKHPSLNSTLDERENELVYRGDYHIGIATATEQGLLVPVVQHADRKSVLEIARDVQRLSEAARAGTLSPSELTGSTFTITSLGRMGGLLATPILNYPEVGILGVHQVKERPIVKDGQIVIGNVMLLSLSFDHRIIDGHIGAAFAYEVISYLEAPELLLLSLS